MTLRVVSRRDGPVVARMFALVACFALLAKPPLASGQETERARESLCEVTETVWFEAEYATNDGAIAICSEPSGDDPIGTIRARQLTPARAGSKAPVPVVIAEASGEDRRKVFTIRRYTRPQVTYLKFEARNDVMTSVIYLADDHGEQFASMREILPEPGAGPAEIELRPDADPFALMGLEDVVANEPFDE